MRARGGKGMKVTDVYYYDCNDGCRYYHLVTAISDDQEEYSYIHVKDGLDVCLEEYDDYIKAIEEDGLKLASVTEANKIKRQVLAKKKWVKAEKERLTKMIMEGLRTERKATAKSVLAEILKGVK
jgi:hypothetical protein